MCKLLCTLATTGRATTTVGFRVGSEIRTLTLTCSRLYNVYQFQESLDSSL
jgi:hypothetical protein